MMGNTLQDWLRYLIKTFILIILVSLPFFSVSRTIFDGDSLKVDYKNRIELFCPIYFFMDNTPVILSPVAKTPHRTSVASLGVSYIRDINSKWSLGFSGELFEMTDYRAIAKRQGISPYPYQGAVMDRTQLITESFISYKVIDREKFELYPVLGFFLRFGGESIQISPTDTSTDHRIGVIQEMRDPAVSIGLKSRFILGMKWSVLIEARYSQMIWRYDKERIDNVPSIKGTTKQFFTLKYGLGYSFGRQKIRQKGQ